MVTTWLLYHDDLIRGGIKGFLADTNFQISEEHEMDGGDAINMPPELIICGMDKHLPSEIMEETKRFRDCYPGSRLVMLASVEKIRVIPDILHCNVDGYLLKDMSRDAILSYLHLAMIGEKVLPPQLAAFREESAGGAVCKEKVGENDLTGREKEVVQCLMQGESNKIIARNLEITESTVKGHLKIILRKLNVKNRTQAAMVATQQKNDNTPPREVIPVAA